MLEGQVGPTAEQTSQQILIIIFKLSSQTISKVITKWKTSVKIKTIYLFVLPSFTLEVSQSKMYLLLQDLDVESSASF